MEIVGLPEVVVRTGMTYADGRAVNVPIVDFVSDTLTFLRDKVVSPLTQFVRP